MKSRYGTIDLFKSDEYTYVIEAFKYEAQFSNMDRYIPGFYIHITKKSSRNRTTRFDDKFDRMQELLGNTWNLSTIRRLISAIRAYLDQWKPEYIMIDAYEDAYDHRLQFYLRELNKLGYSKLMLSDTNFVTYLKRRS
jgi:hypothetical protein